MLDIYCAYAYAWALGFKACKVISTQETSQPNLFLIVSPGPAIVITLI